MVEKRPISRLKIQGFKSLQDVDLELGRLNVLIGPNGAGKSNLISYFDMLRRMVEEDLQFWTGLHGGANRILTFGSKNTPILESTIQFGANAYQFSLARRSGDSFVFRSEEVLMPGTDRRFNWGSGHIEAKLKTALNRPQSLPNMADWCYASISDWKTYHFHDTGQTAMLKQTQGLHDNLVLRQDGANLASYLFKLQHYQSDVYSDIVQTIQLAIPFFRDFVLEPEVNEKGNHDIKLMWRSKHDFEPFLADQMSDGSLRFICLVTALKQPEPPTTIIIDEPELGLHPYALALLGSLLDSATIDSQVIVATQSVSLVNEFSIDDLFVVELEDGVSKFSCPKESDFKVWLQDYAAGELWDKNVLGGGLP